MIHVDPKRVLNENDMFELRGDILREIGRCEANPEPAHFTNLLLCELWFQFNALSSDISVIDDKLDKLLERR